MLKNRHLISIAYLIEGVLVSFPWFDYRLPQKRQCLLKVRVDTEQDSFSRAVIVICRNGECSHLYTNVIGYEMF